MPAAQKLLRSISVDDPRNRSRQRSPEAVTEGVWCQWRCSRQNAGVAYQSRNAFTGATGHQGTQDTARAIEPAWL